MASKRKQGDHSNQDARRASQRHAPELADGLKQLYDSVVEEDLPDSFKDLLDRLDGVGSVTERSGNSGASPSPDTRGAGR